MSFAFKNNGLMLWTAITLSIASCFTSTRSRADTSPEDAQAFTRALQKMDAAEIDRLLKKDKNLNPIVTLHKIKGHLQTRPSQVEPDHFCWWQGCENKEDNPTALILEELGREHRELTWDIRRYNRSEEDERKLREIEEPLLQKTADALKILRQHSRFDERILDKLANAQINFQFNHTALAGFHHNWEIDYAPTSGIQFKALARTGFNLNTPIQETRLGGDLKPGNTFLHLLVESVHASTHPHLVEVFVKNGANVDAKNAEGMTPLQLALQKLNLDNERQARLLADYISYFLQNGADANTKIGEAKDSVLSMAARWVNPELIQLTLTKGGEVNYKNAEHKSPLHLVALALGNYESASRSESASRILNILLDWKADINAEDKDGNTPLHLAILKQKYDIAKVLIEREASLIKANKQGKTPLDLINELPYYDKLGLSYRITRSLEAIKGINFFVDGTASKNEIEQVIQALEELEKTVKILGDGYSGDQKKIIETLKIETVRLKGVLEKIPTTDGSENHIKPSSGQVVK